MAALLLALAAGCQAAPAPAPEERCYSQCTWRIGSEGRVRVDGTLLGEILPMGTPIAVVERGSDALRLRAGERTLVLPLGSADARLSTFIGAEDPAALLGRLAREVVAAILAGEARPGMTRRQVTWALGPPPPDADDEVWVYPRGEAQSVGVIFVGDEAARVQQ